MTGQDHRTRTARVRRRRKVVALNVLLVLIAATGIVVHSLLSGSGAGSTVAARERPVNPKMTTTPQKPSAISSSAPVNLTGSGPGRLAPGSDPSVLPGPILIADKLNNRLLIIDPLGRTLWTFPRPGDLAKGKSFRIPDDAFFTPNGKQIIATEEDDEVIRVIDLLTHKIVYTYGTPGVLGSGPNHLNNPDDALMLPNGDILLPDIKNCRIIVIHQGRHSVSRQLGRPGACSHNPPKSFGSPNGAFPMTDGSYLVTEINGSWVTKMSLSGHVSWSVRLPSVAYPSDSNQMGPDSFLTVDYSNPGQILTFDHTGHVLWRYKPTGGHSLNKPSLALPLPNGDFLANDDANHRVIVVDPRTNRIVWQYGHTHVAGHGAGYLNNPDGVDLYPPNSLLVAHAATRGTGQQPQP